jgi:hypothetical protein
MDSRSQVQISAGISIGNELSCWTTTFTSSAFFTSMDSPLANRIFKQLLSHETCSRYRIYRPRSLNGTAGPRIQTRSFLWEAQEREQQKRYGGRDQSKKDEFWRARNDLWLHDHTEDYKRFPLVTADHLRPRKERPRRVKMTVRDFIEGISHFSLKQLIIYMDTLTVY